MPTQRRYFKELRMQQLRAIVQLEKGKGFAGAAAALNLATPSVWQQVRSLESAFGVALVEVDGTRVSLTEDGRQLVDLAKPIVQGFDALNSHFAVKSREVVRRLSIAAPNCILVNELPASIRQYREEHPEVELTFIDNQSNPARALVENGEVDLAVVGQLTTKFPPSLNFDYVTQYTFMLVCPEGHPLLSLEHVTPADIAHHRLIVQGPGTNARKRVDEVFQQAGLLENLNFAFTAATKEALLQYVKLRFGVAVAAVSSDFLSQSAATNPLKEGLVFRDVANIFGTENIVILRRRHRYEPPHQKDFRDTVLRAFAAERGHGTSPASGEL